MTRPRYVDRGGDLVLRQPVVNRHTVSYTWLLDADWDALDAMCDAVFTRPSGGAVVVRPLAPLVALTCAQIGHGQSAVEPDHDKGWARERDLGFWVPCARGRMDGERFAIEQVAWYQPYLFVDNAAGVMTGRETYGFAKMPATCTMPERPDQPSRFAVETLVIEKFAPTSQARVAELYRLERSDDGLLGTLASSFDQVMPAMVALQARLMSRALGHGRLPRPTWELIENLFADLGKGLVPMLFLKQFRDVTDPEVACYQSIIEAACDLDRWHGGGFIDEHVLTIRPADSHPIARDLGLPDGPIETGWGFWAEYDFTVQPGRTLWQG